jgi:phosphohistidine phosphatase
MTGISPPPSRIYLLRHAKAAPAQSGQRDFDRPLSNEGYAEAEIVADRMADEGYEPELVIASTAQRCRQTAEAIRRAVGPDASFRFVDELYDARPSTYIEILSSQGSVGSVMLVGHNPVIELTLMALIGPDAMAAALPDGYPTAGLAVIDADAASPVGWTLREFIEE